MDLYILYAKIAEILTNKNIKIYKPYVGNYFTSLDMMGVTVTLMKVDNELKKLIDLSANSMGLKQN